MLTKPELRIELATTKELLRQANHNLEVKERCYQAVMNQRDEAEVKVALLTALIDDVIWDELNDFHRKIVSGKMKEIEV